MFSLVLQTPLGSTVPGLLGFTLDSARELKIPNLLLTLSAILLPFNWLPKHFERS